MEECYLERVPKENTFTIQRRNNKLFIIKKNKIIKIIPYFTVYTDIMCVICNYYYIYNIKYQYIISYNNKYVLFIISSKDKLHESRLFLYDSKHDILK